MDIDQSAWDDEDRTPVKGELAVIDGKLAMYINSNDYGGTSGSRWAIKGSRLRFTRVGPNANSQGYVYGFCHQVNPKDDSITVEILGDRESDQLPTGRIEEIPVGEIGRCDPERERWPTGDSWRERSDEELLAQESDEFLTALPFVNSWKSLLGLSAYSKLLKLQQDVKTLNGIIRYPRGESSLTPTAETRKIAAAIQTSIGEIHMPADTINEMTAHENRAFGAVYGALIGDAAGGVLEFMGRKPTVKEAAKAFEMPGGGVFELAPGQFTDDGEMTVTLLRALYLTRGIFNATQVAAGYCNWADSRPFDIGLATRAAFKEPTRPSTVASNQLSTVQSQAQEHNADSKANGSLMRATPLGIAACRLNTQETIDMVKQDVVLTHPNEICIATTTAYVLALRHLILCPKDNLGAIKAASEYLKHNNAEVLQWLDDAANSNLPAATPQAGYVRYGFTYAFHYLEFAFGYRQAILETLAMGGDTDTNACIVGGLVGAYNGLNGIPKQALEKVLACKTEYGQPRPEAYTIKDVQRNLRVVCGFCIPK
jgi:ADP-ribosylglycohydrolase